MTDMRRGSDRIAITGMGLVTSLGLTAATTLAAIRSGIANFSRHETVVVYDDEHGTELTGARVARIPEHIVGRQVAGIDRLIALLAPALGDCIRGFPPHLLQQAIWRIGNHSMAQNASHVLNVLSDVCGFPISADRLHEEQDSSLGRCLFFEDVIQAAATLHRSAQVAVVGCIHSLCDSRVLHMLAEGGSLKSGTNPEGIVAGEAAGVFTLELESHARQRGAHILAYLSAWGRGTESHPWIDAAPSTAMGMRQALGEVVAVLPGKGEEIDVVIADLNGERARADEWAMTATAVLPIEKKVPELMHPADCCGDCGLAMGAVLLATALDVLAGTTRQATVAPFTSDDAGARRVLLLAKGDDVTICETARHDRPSIAVVPAVIEQHQDDASFLWVRRRGLAKKAHADQHDLDQLDERIQANLDGLCNAGEAGWDLAERGLARGDAGDWFTAAFPAFWQGDYDRINSLLDRSDCDITRCKGIASALGWLGMNDAAPFIERLLSAEPPQHRYVGVAASAMHRRDLGHLLNHAVFAPSPFLKARALRAYGEVGRRGQIHLATLKDHFSAEDDAVRFAASWSAALAGSPEALEVLTAFIHTKSPFSEEALNVALRIIKKEAALPLLHDLAQSPDSLRLAVVSAGIIGDSVLIPWLLKEMSNAPLARIAGEAFRVATGIDIAVAEMDATRPEGFASGPSDDPKEREVSLDRDEDLPWPNPELVAAWWEKNKGAYKNGIRHLLGKPITYHHLHDTIDTGRQSDRAAAALELAIMQPGQPLYNVWAPRHSRR